MKTLSFVLSIFGFRFYLFVCSLHAQEELLGYEKLSRCFIYVFNSEIGPKNLFRSSGTILKLASGCPIANKGKVRYEVMAFDGRPIKIEPNASSSSNDGSPVNSGNYISFPVGSKAAKIFQPVKRQRLSTEESEKNGDVDNDEDIRILEEEILELQEYNAKVESEMIKLRTDISQMEQHVRITERDNQSLAQKNLNLSEYYEALRNNFISFLDHVRLPNFDERPTRENLDIYLNRLQSLCAESCREENKAVLSSIKQALQDFNVPTSATNGWLTS